MIYNSIKRTVKVSRPRFWLYLAGPALLGIVYGSDSMAEFLTLKNLFILLYFLVPANLFLYGVNDYFDREIDVENPKKQSKELVYSENFFQDSLVIISGILGLVLGVIIGGRNLFLFSIFLALSIGYSAPPLRFKTKPFLDSVSNGLYLLPALIGFDVVGSFPNSVLIFAGLFWTMAMHTFSAIPDIQPDIKAGIETTATLLGREKTYLYCFISWTLSSILFAVQNIFLGVYFSSYPILISIFYFSKIDDTRSYWFFPFINSFLGMILTLNGLINL